MIQATAMKAQAMADGMVGRDHRRAISDGGSLRKRTEMIGNTGDRITLVIGGAKSGKSRHAQSLAESWAGNRIFIATAQAFDQEMADRIARHRADRNDLWKTVEAPIALSGAIKGVDREDAVILVDCLTLWASNLMLGDEHIDHHLGDLDATLAACRGRVVLVSNEVGWGIVPDNALARRFRDVAGHINQSVARRANRVNLVVAGISLALK